MVGSAGPPSHSYLDLLCLRDAVLVVPQVEGSAHFVQHIHVGTRHFLFKVSHSLNWKIRLAARPGPNHSICYTRSL